MKLRTIPTLLLIMAISAWLTAGITITKENADQKNVEYYDSGRFAAYDNGQPEIIFDANKGLVTQINPEQGLYAEASIAEFKAALKGFLQQSKQMMDEMMAKNPQVAKMMKEQMQKTANAKFEIKAGGHKTILGYDCQLFTLLQDGQVTNEYWLSAALLAKLGQEVDIRQIESLMDEMSSMTAEMGMGFAANILKQQAEIEKKGYTMLEKSSEYGGEPRITSQVTSVVNGPISADKFQPPANMRKVPISQLFMSRMQEGEE